MKYLIFLFLVLLGYSLSAQQSFMYDQGIPIRIGENSVPMPFATGINAAQFQEMDTDGDGKEEIVIWDINSRRILVFKRDAEGFTYLPEMAYYFPSDVNGFLILADFDGDGKKDLFTSSPFGIKAYKNTTPSGNAFPEWELAQNFLRLDNGSNVQANVLDVPLIMDIDGDGDLDILTFNFVVGDYLEFYRNTSMERKGVPDIDGFAFPVDRWGGFEFCECGVFSFGMRCDGTPIAASERDDDVEQARILHAGGHSVLYSDFDGDGISDLLIGQDECSILYFLPNEGTNAAPVFRTFSNDLPEYGPLPEFPIFHTAYLNQDELWIGTNPSSVAGVFNADYARNMFSMSKGQLQAVPFLQPDILDLGENTRPYFKGFNNSGELILTANSKSQGKVLGLAYRFIKNEDGFELVEEDYLGLSALEYSDLQYFEYQNSQGQNTYWISGVDTVNFSLQRRVFFGSSGEFSTMKEINFPITGTRPLDHVELFSFGQKDYLLLAKQSGELVLFSIAFQNDGLLQVEARDFLGFQDNPANRNLNVHVIPGSNPSLYGIDQRGVLVYIEDFMNQNQRETVQVSLYENESRQTKLGRNTWVSSIPEPFRDGRDLILGNTAGGLELLSKTDASIPGEEEYLIRVYPNPSIGDFKILASKDSEMRMVNMLGQVIISNLPIQANREIDINGINLTPGVYILQFTARGQRPISKKVIIRK